MIIDCVADLHGHYPKLEGGDLLIVAGDLTGDDSYEEVKYFCKWLNVQKYRFRVVCAGNHDNWLQLNPNWINCEGVHHLCDSGTEFEGLKIWGSPWTKIFEGMNPHCMAFTVDTEEELAEKWKLIPDDVDILITHCPPYGMKDRTIDNERVGSKSLQMELFERLRPQLIVCGHIHEDYGIEAHGGIVNKLVNASHVNENYEPVNKPIRVEL